MIMFPAEVHNMQHWFNGSTFSVYLFSTTLMSFWAFNNMTEAYVSYFVSPGHSIMDYKHSTDAVW